MRASRRPVGRKPARWGAVGVSRATADRQARRRHPVRARHRRHLDRDGDEAVDGSRVTVHYVGVSFSTGEEFDASWNRGRPFAFKLGKGQVIPGWDAGVKGMKVGGRRRLTIPSAMAYGARGAGGVIKPHEPLVFVVDLLSVE